MTSRRAAVSILTLLLLLSWPSSLRAHGVLNIAEPAAGSRLTVAPTLLRLTFSEAMEAAVSRIVLTGPDSATVLLSPTRRGDSAAVLVADIVGALRAGRYTVVWQGAGRDGHPIHGEYQFTILAAAARVALQPVVHDSVAHVTPTQRNDDGASFGTQSPLFALVRWLQLVATLTIIGTCTFVLLVLPRAARRGAPTTFTADAEYGARSVGHAAAALLCVVVVLRLFTQYVALRAGGAGDVQLSAVIRDTLWGHAWVLQLTAALAALGGTVLVGRARLAGWSVVALSAIAITLATSLSGHAAAAPTQPGVAVFKDVVHVLCVGGWLGTLLLIVVAGIPAALRLAPTERGTAVAATVNAFSPLALTFAGIVVFSGASAAWAHFAPNDDPLHTTYGRVLLIKLSVVAVLMAVGVFNWRWQRPSLGDEEGARRIRTSATAELIVAAFVLAVTSVLLATPTPAPTHLGGRDRAVLDRGRAGE